MSEAWDKEESRLLSAARLMELKMVELLTGMLEGEMDVKVAEHILNVIDSPVVLALLNVHWQKQLAIKRKTKIQADTSDGTPDKRETIDLAFQYFALIDALTDDTLVTPAAMPLRKLFRRWLGAEGKEIMSSIRSIEILDSNGDLGRLHFMLPQFVQLVWGDDDVEEKKQEILTEVSISRMQSRLRAFPFG